MSVRDGYSVNCSIIFTELAINERARAAAQHGFGSVEFWWPFASGSASSQEIASFAGAIEDAGVQLDALNFFGGDLVQGERGILSDPSRVTEFQENVALAVELGQRLHIRAFNALYGNRQAGLSPEEQDELAIEQIAFAAKAAAAIGARIVIEPLSGVDTYPILSGVQAIEVIGNVERASGVTNVFLLADFYHLAVNGDDVDALIANHSERIGHVQIADAPGRNEPGTGTLPLSRWIASARSSGYAGAVGLEYRPSAGSDASFDWLNESF